MRVSFVTVSCRNLPEKKERTTKWTRSIRKYCRCLQENARYSLKKIAENTHLSSLAVSSRIGRPGAGRHHYRIPCGGGSGQAGIPHIAFVNLDVLPGEKPGFYARMAEIPNVLECNCVTGDYSMLLKVAFQSTMELDVFIGEVQKYGKTNTQIVFSTPSRSRGERTSTAGYEEPAGIDQKWYIQGSFHILYNIEVCEREFFFWLKKEDSSDRCRSRRR